MDEKSREPIFSRILWTSLFTLVLTAATQAYAQDSTTQSFGGGGGDPYTVGCGGDKLMVGLAYKNGEHGLAGLHLDLLRPVCSSVDAGGAWMGTTTQASSFAGKDNANSLITVMCPKNEAISGFGGYAGLYVDGLNIYCSSVGEFGRVNDDQHKINQFIAFQNLEGFKGPFSCPNSKPAKSITGKAHDWIDRFGLVCNFPTTPAPTVDDITFTNSVVGGQPLQGTVKLNAPAPSAGIEVGISRQYNPDDAAFFPTNSVSPNPLIVPSGSKSVSFVFNTVPVPRVVTVKLNPGPGSATHFVSRTLTVVPPSLTTVALSFGLTSPGSSVTGTITLNSNAPAGGLTANLTSSFPEVANVPPSVSISAGNKSATFPIAVGSANEAGCSVISASGLYVASGGTAIRQALLGVKGPQNPAFKLSVSSIVGSTATGTVSVELPVKVATTLTLVSNNPLLVVPASVSIAPNEQSNTFPITVQSLPPSGINCGVITATDQKGSKNSMVFQIGSSLRRME